MFLPRQMNEEQTLQLITKIIKDDNLVSLKDMGKLMSLLKSNYSGSIDMTLAGKLAKTKLIN
jgi:hypothetical protein